MPKPAKEYQRNIVVVDYPGLEPPAMQVMHDYDKVYEGTLSFNTSMTEACIRERISSLIQQKESGIYDFSGVIPQDFESVKCVNRRIRLPDGNATYSGEGLKDIYIRLTCSFYKYKVHVVPTVFDALGQGLRILLSQMCDRTGRSLFKYDQF